MGIIIFSLTADVRLFPNFAYYVIQNNSLVVYPDHAIQVHHPIFTACFPGNAYDPAEDEGNAKANG